MTDPNVTTTPEGETLVLEPGDPGYVDPNAAPNAMEPEPHAEGEALDPPLPVQQAVDAPPQDLRLLNEPGQSESEAIVMARGTVVDSQNATDLVPNTPQIRMGPQEEVVVEDAPEGLATVEATDAANTLQDEEAEPDHESARELIAEAEAAQTTAELDRIEGQAEGRVTVLKAVEARRAEL